LDGPHSDTHKNNGAGSQLYLRSWALANSSVVDYITLLVSMSEYRQSFLDLQLRDRLSVADAIVLHQHLGLSKAANFIDVVDPWCYPDDDTPAVISVKGCLQSVVDKVTSEKLSEKTEASIAEFLLSPLLMKKGRRPSLVLKPKAERSGPSRRIAVSAAATVARKPSSPASIDLPIDQGNIFSL
jgi:hypothetical protein